MTAVVAAKLAAAARFSSRLWVCRENRLSRWLRRLKQWKISAMDMVRKAMVVPSGEVATSHRPDSIK